MTHPMRILVVGATGGIGRLVVAKGLREGYAVRALVRDLARATDLPARAERAVGDLTRANTLVAPLASIDAVVFTHGSNDGKSGAEHIDYGGVRNVLTALGGDLARLTAR